MMKRMALKVALVQHSEPAYRLAQQLDRSESFLSKLIYGLRDPSRQDAVRIARYLDRPIEELFPEIDSKPKKTA